MKYIFGNFKQNMSETEISSHAKQLSKLIKNPQNVAVFVPDVYVSFASKIYNKFGFSVGGQNLSKYSGGAHTGEVSASMLYDCGAKYVLVGHSEVRAERNYDNTDIQTQLYLAIKSGLTPVLCVGERAEERKTSHQVLDYQLEVLKNIENKNVIVAYEPVWAIGANSPATEAEILDAVMYIKATIGAKYNALVPVLYGGSVTDHNSAQILNIAGVDGVLVGSASLSANAFANIYNSQK